MAYVPANLHLESTAANGVQVWRYRTTDTDDTVIVAGYISDAYSKGMQVGDTVVIDQFSTTAFTSLTAKTFHACTASVDGTGATLSSAISGGTVVIAGSGASNPTANTDVSLGYAAGSFYLNTTTDDVFLCSDASDGAAVWEPVGPNKVVLCYNAISSKASDAAVARFAAPFKFKIVDVRTVLNAALATGDATFTTAIAGTGVTDGVVTATQAGSAAGDVDVATPSALNTGAAGALITVTVGGASTATATANVQVTLAQVM